MTTRDKGITLPFQPTYLSVKDSLYGAKGDGVTDDTSAIQSAINAATEGSVIFFPVSAGHYVFTQLTISKTVWLVGAGWHCGLQANFADSGWLSTTYISGSILRSTYTGAGSAITCTTIGKGPRFKDIALIGPGSGTSTAITFGSLASYQVLGKWDDFFIANFYVGVVLTNVEDWTFDTVRFRAISTTALTLQSGGAAPNVTQCVFLNLEIQRCTTGILITEASTIAFIGGLLQNITTPVKLVPSANGRIGNILWKQVWFEANTNNVVLDITSGGIQFLEFDGTNHNGAGNFFTLTNPSNWTVSRLGFNGVAASGWILDLSSGASVGPAYIKISGKRSQFSSIVKSNSTVDTDVVSVIPTTALSTGLPFVVPSSGNMGNNGVLTAITAVAAVYTSAYCYFPANAIVAGSAAGWYYTVFSSTTTATVYNNTYVSGVPTVPSSPTAFATVGPGAYVQTTGVYIPGPQVLVPGNSLGIQGNIRWDVQVTNNNSANGKFWGVYVSSTTALGTRFMTYTATVNTNGQFMSITFLNNNLALQNTMGIPSTGLTQVAALRTALNFASDFYLQVTTQLSNAADTITIEGVNIAVSP